MRIFPELEEIKKLRRDLNLSQDELASKVKMTQSTISRIESGTVDPPYTKVKQIFEFLDSEKLKKKRRLKKAANIMSPKPKTISSTSKIKDAIKIMNLHGISQLPVIDEGKNVGSITAKKIQKTITDHPELLNAEIELVMELAFPEIEEDWYQKEISQLLMNYPAVLVKKNKKYVGIITDADFLKFA